MAVIDATNLNLILDNILLGRLAAIGTSAGYGLGDATNFGAYEAVDDAFDALGAMTDADATIDFGRQLRTFRNLFNGSSRYGEWAKAPIIAMDRHCARFGASNYSDLNTYLTYLNTVGTKWEALQDPSFYDFYYSIKRAYPAVNNVYFEALQGAFDLDDHLYTHGLGRFVATGAGTGNFTAGVVEGGLITGGSIDSSKYCGGFLKLKVSGLAGTGNVTVTGIFYDPATKAVTTSATMITNITGDGTTTAVIGGGTAPADALIIRVTNITTAAGITAGTIYAESHRPSGRSLLK
jgi:hypothetical protein